MLIGGFAVIAHGGSRFTKDVGLLVDDAPENVARVKQALSVLADNAQDAIDRAFLARVIHDRDRQPTTRLTPASP